MLDAKGYFESDQYRDIIQPNGANILRLNGILTVLGDEKSLENK